MQSTEENPQLSTLLRAMTILEVVVLLGAASTLFFLPAVSRPNWPWEITPFNTRFMGAIYVASLLVVIVLASNNRWSPARVLLPMIFVFTAWVLLISILYVARFDFGKIGTWTWFIFYTLLPINAGYHLWKYRQMPPAVPVAVPNALRLFLWVLGIGLIVYAAALIVAPPIATAFWPWSIDDFHSRIYAAMFLAGGIGSLLGARSASAGELSALGLGQASFGLFALLGLFIVDGEVHKINWSLPGTWVWIAIFAAALVSGIGYMVLARQKKPLIAAQASQQM